MEYYAILVMARLIYTDRVMRVKDAPVASLVRRRILQIVNRNCVKRVS